MPALPGATASATDFYGDLIIIAGTVLVAVALVATEITPPWARWVTAAGAIFAAIGTFILSYKTLGYLPKHAVSIAVTMLIVMGLLAVIVRSVNEARRREKP